MRSGGSGLQRKVLCADLCAFHLLTLPLGVGSTKPNKQGGEGSGGVAPGSWKELLNNDDGVYSLKPLGKTKPNKKKLAFALRHIMREAWSECHPIFNVYFLKLVMVIQ